MTEKNNEFSREEKIEILCSYIAITKGLKNEDNDERYNKKLDLRIQAYELLLHKLEKGEAK